MTDRYEERARNIVTAFVANPQSWCVDADDPNVYALNTNKLCGVVAKALRDAAAESSLDKADPQRIIDWLREKPRQRAVHAFTEGPERQIAYQVEMAIDEAAAEARKRTGLLQDFACRISDIMWGGELGWESPSVESGLKRLAEDVRTIRARMDKEG